MKRVFGLILALLLAGCSGGIYTPLAELEVGFDMPLLGLTDDMPVVYPYQGAGRAGRNPMVDTFGPSWRDLHSDYSEYRFNP